MNKENKTRPEPEQALRRLAARDCARAEQNAAAMQQRIQAIVAVEWQRVVRRRFVRRVGSAAASLVAMVGVGWLLFSQFAVSPPLAKQGEPIHPRVAKAKSIDPVVPMSGAGSTDSLPGGAAPAAFTLRPESAPQISPQPQTATRGGKNLPCVAIQSAAPDSTLSAEEAEKEEETDGSKKEAKPQPRP